MGKGVGWMSVKEADRVVVIRDVVEKRLRQGDAAATAASSAAWALESHCGRLL